MSLALGDGGCVWGMGGGLGVESLARWGMG